jgi:hypothetical protein
MSAYEMSEGIELLRCENRLLAEALLETQRKLRAAQKGLADPV